MKKNLSPILFILIWINTGFAASLPENIIYLFPKPDTQWAPQAATIIVKARIALRPGELYFTVSKSDGKSVPGEMINSDDPRIAIFKPFQTFTAGEKISVHLSGCISFSWKFQVSSDTHELQKYAIDQDHKESLPNPFESCYSSGQARSINGVSVPGDFPSINLNTNGATAPGKIFFAVTFGNTGGYIVILNNDGTPCFYRRYPRAGDKCVGDFSVQPTGVLTAYSYYYQHYIVLDHNYNEIDTYKAGHGYTTDSHELQLLENGHALILGRTDQNYIVQELDQNKNVIFEWNCLEHYRVEDAIHGDSNDPVHLNSIAVDFDGHLILSARSQGEVSKIHRETGEFIWRLGGVHNQFKFINDPDKFTAQHHVTPVVGHPNRYTIFDNGNYHSPRYSRGVEFQIDPDALTAEQIWQYVVKDFAFMMGNTQRLPNGNTFIDYSSWPPGRAVEVTPDGIVVQSLEILNASSYRTRRFEWEGVSEIPYLIAEGHTSGVLLIFNKFNDPNVLHYNIYGGQSSNPTTLLATSTETNILLTNLTNDKDYYFRVTAVTSNDRESKFSNTEMVHTRFCLPGANMIINGDFTSKTENWYFITSNQASAKGKVNSSKQYVVSITNGGQYSTDVILAQPGTEILNGREYRFEFDAFADSSRLIDAAIFRGEPPYDNYGRIGSTGLKTHPRHYVYDFKMEYPNDFNALVLFACGGSNINVTIDNISLKQKVPQSSFTGSPQVLPGTIQCEEYDWGGEDIAFHDDATKEGNNTFRPGDNVDVESTSDDGGGYYVGWTLASEWLEYTVDIESGVYEIKLRTAAVQEGGKLEVLLDGTRLTTFNIPSTGGLQTWMTLTNSGIKLDAGKSQVLRLNIVQGNININWLRFVNTTSTAIDKQRPVFEYGLHQNYPNPFNPVTRIDYQLPEAKQVYIKIFNVLGQHVRTLVDEFQIAGRYRVIWDGCGENGIPEASGIYLVSMQAGSFTAVRKISFIQ